MLKNKIIHKINNLLLKLTVNTQWVLRKKKKVLFQLFDSQWYNIML